MADEVVVRSLRSDVRTAELRRAFEKRFGVEPDVYVRVPGRVNLIGEHIDYCGYPVLPMAVEQNVLVAAKRVDTATLDVINVNDKYPDYTNSIGNIPKRLNAPPEWYEYVMCGVVGSSQLNHSEMLPHGLLLAVSGNVPPAAGLSSSSALVCAAAMARLAVNKIQLDRMDMAKLCCESERMIGTNGGGMDQAIAFLAQEGCAQYISWNPLLATPVRLPDNAVFVIANSLVMANKAATSDYNTRVSECKLAAKLIAADVGLSTSSFQGLAADGFGLKALQDALNASLEEMVEYAGNLPEDMNGLKPRARAVHVFSEAMRVERFRDACDNLKSGDDWEKRLGELMAASHDSLSRMYECSHPSLDRMVQLSREFGVYARLTGAGWGGCIVALCTREKVTPYIDMMVERYYSQIPNIDDYDISTVIFKTSPQTGAFMFVPVDE